MTTDVAARKSDKTVNEEAEIPAQNQTTKFSSQSTNASGSDYSDYEDRDYAENLVETITFQHLKTIAYELGLITLCWPEIKHPEFEHRTSFPKSYYTNNTKERLILLYAENFRKQYNFKFVHRKQLFLACENECGIQKFVSTTIRPTTLPYQELQRWQECARFTSDHIQYETLEKPTNIPERLISPNTTLQRERGHSFEMATLLCSLLIGAGYDAYVVYGYAIADVTRNYQGRVDCPLPYDVEEEEEKPAEEINIKYQLKPPRDLRSQFYVMLEQKEIEKAAAEVAREVEKRRKEIEELERAEPDKLQGMRVHGWVIILGGTDIEEPFFIEPSTGIAHKVDVDIYTGLEAIWNDRNYWVNLQSCGTGLAAIDWTLSNTALWEHLLPGENKTRTEEKAVRRRPGDDDPDPLGQLEKHLDMPTSWCERIQIPFTLFEKRFPGGRKHVRYRCCRADQYGEYLQVDGLISRITLYFDYELTEPTFAYELYSHRSDGLYKSKRNLQTELVVDYFRRGRDDAVREHHYNMVETSVEAERTLKFYWQCRVDGLVHLEMSPKHMRQVFIGRDDLLLERIVRFEERAGTDTTHRRNVANVIERFDRDPSKKANDDIRVCEYALDDNEYRLKYHYEKDQITSSTREFIKPNVSEMGDRLTFNPDKTSGYQANINAKPPRQLLLFRLLLSLIERESVSLYLIRIQEDEVLAFLRLRAVEHAVPRLTVSLYHPERNVEARRGIQKREQKARELSAREVDVETDYLAPQMARLGHPGYLSYKEAKMAYSSCLEDFQQMLVNRANDIQRQFNELSNSVEERQTKFDLIRESLSPIQIDKYLAEISEANFALRVFEARLDRHQELAHSRYMALQTWLNLDKRLQVLWKKY